MFFNTYFIFIVYTHTCKCICMPMTADSLGGQKRASHPLELELQVTVSHPCGCWEVNSGTL